MLSWLPAGFESPGKEKTIVSTAWGVGVGSLGGESTADRNGSSPPTLSFLSPLERLAVEGVCVRRG